ncbi:MAG: putative RNA methyltransferase [Endozoicomonas sp.]
MSITLRCPVCHSPLQSMENGVSCSGNHRFDRARQGYLHLLPSNRMRSKSPGDDKQMVQARNRFLDSGCYTSVSSALTEATTRLVKGNPQPAILDAGCGEGYYTASIKNAVPDASVCGVDISKPAILACCRRRKDVQWLVASVSDLPIVDQSVDIIVSVFSRCDWREFARVLKPGGHILVLAPGQNHLQELREAIYEDVRPYPVDKLVQDLPKPFSLVGNQSVSGEMQLGSSQQILDLLAMTPHYWHIKPPQRESLEQRQALKCRFDMKLYTISL